MLPWLPAGAQAASPSRAGEAGAVPSLRHQFASNSKKSRVCWAREPAPLVLHHITSPVSSHKFIPYLAHCNFVQQRSSEPGKVRVSTWHHLTELQHGLESRRGFVAAGAGTRHSALPAHLNPEPTLQLWRALKAELHARDSAL